MKKKNKSADWDDGRVIADMSGVGGRKRVPQDQRIELSKKERRSMARALFTLLLPRMLFILLGFGLAIGIVILWLM